MPLSVLRPEVTRRFHEVNLLLTSIVAQENFDPSADTIELRIIRGLFFVHLYGAMEYAIDQSFNRVARHVTAHPVQLRHLEKVVYSVAMDPTFESMRTTSDWKRRFTRRIEMITQMAAIDSASISDTVLSDGMQSVDTNVIRIAFDVYGIKAYPFVEDRIRGYIDEVTLKRHAVAHGRTSPAEIGILRSPDLRIRYDAVYRQTIYVMDTIEEFLAARKFVAPRFRVRYPA